MIYDGRIDLGKHGHGSGGKSPARIVKISVQWSFRVDPINRGIAAYTEFSIT